MENKENLSQRLDKIFNIKEEDKIYDRKDILNLFELYLKGEIDETEFESKFYLMYTRDGATNFSKEEEIILTHLGNIIEMYSPYEEDQIIAPGVYIREEKFRESVISAKKELDRISNNKG